MEVGYCIQAATDRKNKLFVHADIGGSTDRRELGNIALAVKDLLNLKTFNTLSDAGYATGDQFDMCKSAGITTYCSPMPSTSPRKNCFPRDSFIYDKQKDHYTCPAGNQMKRMGKNGINRGNYKSYIYKTNACKTCSIRQKCTNNPKGRILERSEYQNVIDENKQRVTENRDYYRLRQQVIEHQFGTLKRQWGFTFTLMKGKENVLSEVNLLMMVYNLGRSTAILGKYKMKKLLEKLVNKLFSIIDLFECNQCDIFKRKSNFFLCFKNNSIFITH